ncbi:hypothetical protein U1Q18_002811 [Sarracenia purpurea var. burkii]
MNDEVVEILKEISERVSGERVSISGATEAKLGSKIWQNPFLFGGVHSEEGDGRALFSAEKSLASGFGITDFSVAENHTVRGLRKKSGTAEEFGRD